MLDLKKANFRNPFEGLEISKETLMEYQGQTIAINKANGMIMASASSTAHLDQLMEENHPNVRYRCLACP